MAEARALVRRTSSARRPLYRRRRGRFAGRTLLYLCAVGLTLAFLGPFVWTIGSSLKTAAETQSYPPKLWPDVPQWANYALVWTRVPFGIWLFNSVLVAFLVVLGNVLSSSLVAYAFARFRFPGRELLFMLLISTIMLPYEVTLIPTYLLFHYIKWLDTFRPLIVPAWLGGSAFGIFLLRQFFQTLPLDLDEAAKLDGAGHFRIYREIILPLSGPALATLAVISFVGEWDSFIHPLIFLNSQSKFTLAIGLRYFQTLPDLSGDPTEHLLMAASTMMSAPPILLYFLAQRYFVRGIVMSGIKG